MNRDAIRTRIRDNLAELTDNEDLAISDRTVASQAAGWDSICHIKLIAALEEDFDVLFDVAEFSMPEDVGGLIDMIQHKRKAAGLD